MTEISLRLLSLLSPVLQDEGLRGLANARIAADPATIADGSATFYRALSASGESTAADYLRTKLLTSDNVFARAAADRITPALTERVDLELSVLAELVSAPCTRLRDKLPPAERPLFPVWESGVFSLTARQLADEYTRGGYGIVRTASAFTFDRSTHTLVPIGHRSEILPDDLKEYAEEKEAVLQNTRAFLENRPAQHVLLYGDRGTGKSSTIHALCNHFAPQGLKLVQLTKADIPQLPQIKELLSSFPRLHFIVFLDDLTMEENDEAFGALKAALEGDLSTAPNVRIYATTNRRHVVRETHASRQGDDVHAADTVEEQLSLFDRFGLVLTYIAPDKRQYLSILGQILRDAGMDFAESELTLAAERYALEKGGRSPRAARQFADSYIAARKKAAKK